MRVTQPAGAPKGRSSGMWLLALLAIVLAFLFGRHLPDAPGCRNAVRVRDVSAKLEAALERHVAGHRRQKQKLLAHVKVHCSNLRYRKPKGLRLHLTGPSGVGKSFLARLVAQSFFEEQERAVLSLHEWWGVEPRPYPTQCGVAWYKFASLESEAAAFKAVQAALAAAVAEVRRCPQAVLIFEDVNRLPPAALNQLEVLTEPFLQGVHGGWTCWREKSRSLLF